LIDTFIGKPLKRHCALCDGVREHPLRDRPM
jgi:hypothetical protein